LVNQGDYSERIEALPNSQVQDEVMGVLKSMYPGVEIPEPDAFYYDKWYSDPLYRGSYSNWPASFFQEHHDNLRATVSHRLWFAGEHTSQKYFGALFSFLLLCTWVPVWADV
jgi:polyamine oxidase